MAFERLNYGKSWTNPVDFPAYQESEEQVRADLQYHPDAVKEYINETLLKALQAQGAAGNLGANTDGGAATVQGVLDQHKERITQLAKAIEDAVLGTLPGIVQSSSVAFTDESWTQEEDQFVLTIMQTDHLRNNGNYGYNLYQLTEDIYRSGTWGTASTRAVYNDDGSITLTADEAYSGRIVFFGW